MELMHIINGRSDGKVRGSKARRAEKLATIPGRPETGFIRGEAARLLEARGRVGVGVSACACTALYSMRRSSRRAGGRAEGEGSRFACPLGHHSAVP